MHGREFGRHDEKCRDQVERLQSFGLRVDDARTVGIESIGDSVAQNCIEMISDKAPLHSRVGNDVRQYRTRIDDVVLLGNF